MQRCSRRCRWPLAPGGHRPEPGMTRQQGDQILQELRQIRQLLEKQGRPARAAAGRAAHARQDHRPERRLHAGLQGRAADDRGVHRLPVPVLPALPRDVLSRIEEELHRYRQGAFLQQGHAARFPPQRDARRQAARCAGEQGKFWELRDIMGANPDKLDMDHIAGFRRRPEDGHAKRCAPAWRARSTRTPCRRTCWKR